MLWIPNSIKTYQFKSIVSSDAIIMNLSRHFFFRAIDYCTGNSWFSLSLPLSLSPVHIQFPIYNHVICIENRNYEMQ